MSQTEPTVAEQRKWLQGNGYPVGARGILSAEHKEAYASQRPANAGGTEIPAAETTQA